METKPITQEEQDDFFRVTNEMWKKASEVYELVDNHYENRKVDDEEKLGLDELKNLSNEIDELRKEKTKLTKKAIGYMYNGVLVSGDISCRRGEVYRFRCQYGLSNTQIKESVMGNLQEVGEKLTSTNLAILEKLLELVSDEDETNRYSRYNRYNDEGKAKLDLDEALMVAEFERDSGVGFKAIKSILISENGDISFNSDEDEGVRLERYTKYMIKAKLKDELIALSENFIEAQTKKRDELLSEVGIIKSQASNLLMLAEIDKQEDNY